MLIGIIYRNHRNEVEERTIYPMKLYWGISTYHVTPQMLLDAYCCSRKSMRTFALLNILEWTGQKGTWEEFDSINGDGK